MTPIKHNTIKLSLGFSPCPNDTFIFDALVNKKIDTDGFAFEVFLEDVETLNQWALQKKLDVSKISYGALPLLLKDYIVLSAGGALGKGVGPLLVSKRELEAGSRKSEVGGRRSEVGSQTSDVRRQKPEDRKEKTENKIRNSIFDIRILAAMINNMRVAIPGEHTTAHILFSLAFPEAKNKYFTIFSAIEEAVLNEEADAGVIIHESRFTYRQKGLHKLIDLGEYWEQQTGLPIPLGGIAVKRNLTAEIQLRINNLIKKSIEHAFNNYPNISDYVKQHAQEMQEQTMRQHIDLYVNNYSMDLGKDGKKAVEQLLKIYTGIHNSQIDEPDIFLEQ